MPRSVHRAPASSSGFGVNYNWFYFGTQGVNTYSGISAEDAQKVVYTSPNFNGLTIGNELRAGSR